MDKTDPAAAIQHVRRLVAELRYAHAIDTPDLLREITLGLNEVRAAKRRRHQTPSGYGGLTDAWRNEQAYRELEDRNRRVADACRQAYDLLEGELAVTQEMKIVTDAVIDLQSSGRAAPSGVDSPRLKLDEARERISETHAKLQRALYLLGEAARSAEVQR